MFDPEYMIFCAGKSADDNGNISLHGIFDRVFVREFPVRHSPFLLTARLRAKKAIVNQELSAKLVIDREGIEAGSQTIKLPVTVEKDNAIVLDIDLQGFVFPEAGRYSFNLYIEDKLMLSRPIRLQNADELVEA